MKTSIILTTILFFLAGINFCAAQNTSTENKNEELNKKNIKGGIYTSKSTIKASGTVKKGTEKVTLKAEEGITLKAGFISEAGTDLILKIEEVEEPKTEVSDVHAIHISPNPFKYSTTISYSLPKKEMTNISIYDGKDNLVKRLLNSEKEKGEHEFEIEPANLSSGVYNVVLKTADAILVKKMIVIE